MPFDDEKFYGPAKRHDVAAVALKANRALLAICSALASLRQGEEIDAELARLREISNELDAMFDELTGYAE